jgi:hypothetical protein
MLKTISHLPPEKRSLLEELVEKLSGVKNLVAVVLGGSYASGTQYTGSDLDVGLYYFEANPFAIDDIRRVAQSMLTEGTPTVTDFYGWGNWVNGGAWIHTPQGKVDFLYRNIDQVQQTIEEARQDGLNHHDYDQQPAYGFYSVIYLAETQICLPLYDPEGVVADLKQQVEVYPPKLKAKTLADTLWQAEFTLLHARGFAAQGDVYNAAGCLTRAATNLTQALFALNERYFIRDKQVMKTLAGFPILPEGYTRQVERILACPGSTAQELAQSVSAFEAVWRSVVALDEVQYQPQFRL